MNITAEQYNNEGVQFFLKGKLTQAKEKYQAALEEMPNYAATLNNLGMISLQERNYQEAVTYFERAIEQTKQATYYLNLGHAKVQLNQIDEAIVAYQQSISINPETYRAWKSIGSLYQAQRNYTASINVWVQSLSIFLGNTELLFQLAKDYMAVQKYKEAFEIFENTHFPEELHGEVAYCVASLHMQFKNFGLAENTIKTSLINDPEEKRYRSLLAVIYLAQSKLDKALQQWDFLLKLTPNDYDVRVNKAVALLANGFYEAAATEINFVLLSEEEHVKALYYKALLLITEGKDKEEARKILTRLRDIPNEFSQSAGKLLINLNQ